MSKTPVNPNKRSRLYINKIEANLNRHPSAKSLFDEMGNKKNPSDDSNSEKDFYSCTIEYNSENNNNIKYENFLIKIDKCDFKMLDEKETFYVKDDINNINNTEVYNNKNIIKPLTYQFNDSQKKFDDEVTKEMAQGKDYKSIEKKFLSILKKKC